MAPPFFIAIFLRLKKNSPFGKKLVLDNLKEQPYNKNNFIH